MERKASRRVLPIGQALALGMIAASGLSPTIGGAQSVNWASTNTSAHPTNGAVFQRLAQDSEFLSVVVSLKLRNERALDSFLASQQSPNAAEYRHWLTSADILDQYAPSEAQTQKVVAYLTRSGFTNIEVAKNRLLVSASGTVGAARRAFNTEIAHFVRDGHDGIANTSDVHVPSALSDTVLSVLGLQTLDQLHTVTVQSHNPTAFPTIYDSTGLPTGSKTAVAIIAEGSLTQTVTDLHTFESKNALTTINPVIVYVGGQSGDTSGTDEWDLDSQNIQAAAGGQVSELLFYVAPNFTDSVITQAFNKAVTDNIAKVINVSLGYCETAPYNDGVMATADAIFKTAIAQGQTFSVASGDHGSKECGAGANGSFGTIAGESWPASSPYVIAVGGTTLSTNANGTYASESAWTYSGGGPSLYEPQPAWQIGLVSGTKRGVPDIAFDGDPASGATVIVNGSSVTYGGTSLSSPIFVGSWARLQSAHSNTLGFPAAWFYQYGEVRPASAFHDVTSGSNGDYTASVGWDYVTGWGSLDVGAINSVIGGTGKPPAEPVQIVPNAPPYQFTNDNVEPVSVTPSSAGAPATYFTFCKTDDIRGQVCHTSTTPSFTFTMINGSTNNFQANACNAAGCSAYIVSPTTVSYCANYSCP